MAIQITKKSEDYSVAPQLSIEDVAEIAAAGFKTIFNFRPDNESPADQPAGQAIALAAAQHGLQYHHIPVVPNNIQTEQLALFNTAYAQATKPALGFCKSGNRATQMFERIAPIAAAPQKGMIAWLKSKCLMTKLIRWIKQKA